MVFHSLLVGLLASGGVAVSWQTDVAAPPAVDSAPLFTPGPGSVGAAANLESPARIRDLGDSARRGWNDGGILDLEALGPGKASGGQANSATLAGTEFEEADAPRPASGGPSAGATKSAGATQSAVGQAGVAGQAGKRETNGGSSIVVVSAGGAAERGSPTPDRWADRRSGATPATPTPDVALTAADVGVDCGWLGLGCASRGIWMAIGGLGAAGIALAALIVRELYFGR
jgi:hypothetical protein